MWLLLLACGGSPEAPAPEVAPAPEPVAAPAPPSPSSTGGIELRHHRVNKGRKTPEHVSATWVGEGESSALQVMLTGLPRSCEPEPVFSIVAAGNRIRLVEAPFEAQGECKGSHTVMLQLVGQAARDLTVDVVRADGSVFASTEVGADEH